MIDQLQPGDIVQDHPHHRLCEIPRRDHPGICQELSTGKWRDLPFDWEKHDSGRPWPALALESAAAGVRLQAERDRLTEELEEAREEIEHSEAERYRLIGELEAATARADCWREVARLFAWHPGSTYSHLRFYVRHFVDCAGDEPACACGMSQAIVRYNKAQDDYRAAEEAESKDSHEQSSQEKNPQTAPSQSEVHEARAASESDSQASGRSQWGQEKAAQVETAVSRLGGPNAGTGEGLLRLDARVTVLEHGGKCKRHGLEMCFECAAAYCQAEDEHEDLAKRLAALETWRADVAREKAKL